MPIKYEVNKEKKVVVVIATGTQYNAYNYIEKRMGFLDIPSLKVVQGVTLDRYNIADRFVAVARCAEGDVWDEELGKKVALTKVQAKIRKATVNAIALFLKDIGALMSRFIVDFQKDFSLLLAVQEDNGEQRPLIQ